MGHVRDYSEETASEIDAVLRKIISNAYHQTEQVLKIICQSFMKLQNSYS